MKNFRLFVFSLISGNAELFLLELIRLQTHRFFREKQLPRTLPIWRQRSHANAEFPVSLHRSVGGER